MVSSFFIHKGKCDMVNSGKIIGIILAGGESRRFGSPKALAVYNGKCLIQYSYELLKEYCDELIVISHSDLKAQLKSVVEIEITEDLGMYKGKGPLAGIMTGMEEKRGDWYMVMPCDTPKMSEKVLSTLLKCRSNEYDAVIPIVNGKIQPLAGIYHIEIKPKIKSLLEQNIYKMTALLDMCNVRYISEQELGVGGEEFMNINHFSDFEQLNSEK